MRIFKDDSEIKLAPSEVVAVRLQADSIEEASTVQSSYTNEVAVPLTRENTAIIGNVQAGDATGNEYTAPEVRLYTKKNILVIPNGLLFIRRVENTSAVCNIVQGTKNFFEELEGYDMQMLAPASIGTPVIRNEPNVVANIDNDYTSGFSYATADFGDNPTTTFTVANMWPFSFVYDLFQRIADETNYSFDTSTGLFTDTLFRKQALAYSGTRYNEEAYFLADIGGYNITAGTAGPGVYVTVRPQSFPIPNRAFDAFGFEILEERKSMILEAYWSVDITPNAGNYEYNVRIRNITQGITYASFSSGAVGGAANPTTDSQTIRSSLTRNYNNGDIIRLEIDAVTGTLFDFTEGYFRNDDRRSGNGSVGTSPTIPNPYTEPNTTIVLDSLALMPKISCIDFIKAVCNMFCARLNVDTVTKIITIEKFEDYGNDTANAEDWSGKIDSANDIELEYAYGNYSQLNLFSFSNDSEVPEDYGSGDFNISNTQLDQKATTVIELPFATSQYNNLGSLTVPILTGGNLTEELTERIVYLESTTGSITVGATPVTDYNETYQSVWESYTGNAGDTDADDTGLLGTYWARYRLSLQTMQKLTIYLKLTATDIAELDFFKPKYISYSNGLVRLGGYYYLQLVEDWTGEETVKCELINLNII